MIYENRIADFCDRLVPLEPLKRSYAVGVSRVGREAHQLCRADGNISGRRLAGHQPFVHDPVRARVDLSEIGELYHRAAVSVEIRAEALQILPPVERRVRQVSVTVPRTPNELVEVGKVKRVHLYSPHHQPHEQRPHECPSKGGNSRRQSVCDHVAPSRGTRRALPAHTCTASIRGAHSESGGARSAAAPPSAAPIGFLSVHPPGPRQRAIRSEARVTLRWSESWSARSTSRSGYSASSSASNAKRPRVATR